MSRSLPNILITGTPGVGKTTTAAMIAVSNQQKMKSGRPINKENNSKPHCIKTLLSFALAAET